jgi:zinc transporter ZupT
LTPYLWRVVYSFAAGLSVGVVTAVVTSGFAAAWTWSSIHSGSRGTGAHVLFWVLTLSTLVAPPVLGFIAGRATYRWIGKHNPDAQ